MKIASYAGYAIHYAGNSYNCPALRGKGLYGYSTDRACAKAIARALKQKFSDALLLVTPETNADAS